MTRRSSWWVFCKFVMKVSRVFCQNKCMSAWNVCTWTQENTKLQWRWQEPVCFSTASQPLHYLSQCLWNIKWQEGLFVLVLRPNPGYKGKAAVPLCTTHWWGTASSSSWSTPWTPSVTKVKDTRLAIEKIVLPAYFSAFKCFSRLRLRV